MKHQNMEKWGKATASTRYGSVNGKLNTAPKANDLQAPQDIQDQHEPGYSNDAHGWVRGMGKESPYPAFDKKGSRG